MTLGARRLNFRQYYKVTKWAPVGRQATEIIYHKPGQILKSKCRGPESKQKEHRNKQGK